MTREEILTVRVNNWLTLALGYPTLIYGFLGLATSVMTDFWGFVGLIIIGAIY